MDTKYLKLCIIGLGYVGLPLAVEFGKKRNTLGFDINKKRISELKQHKDTTLAINSDEISEAKFLNFSSFKDDLINCNCYIVTVPTPIDEFNKPNLQPLKDATSMIAKFLKPGDIIIYESTVYPGCTEEVCIPILEKNSGLNFNIDFFCGYSPERINPGDDLHRLKDIKKVTSGSNESCAILIDNLYNEIIEAGTFKAKSIKVAEAAKIIENTQRDINIALINELSMLFNEINIDTEAVLNAAETKWNFNSYKPGLVGGHCISVDPYYLTYKAEQIGFQTKMILAGREINNYVPKYVANKLLEKIKQKSISKNARILIMGITFKENCTDIRNSKVIELINFISSFKDQNFKIDIFDPWLCEKDSGILKNFNIISKPEKDNYEALIIAVKHKEFIELGQQKIKSFLKKNSVLFDLKYTVSSEDSDFRL